MFNDENLNDGRENNVGVTPAAQSAEALDFDNSALQERPPQTSITLSFVNYSEGSSVAAAKQLLDCFYDCGRNFHTSKQRKNHHRYEHPATIRVYQCKLCSFNTLFSSVPSVHIRSCHNKETTTTKRRLCIRQWFNLTVYENPDRKTPRSPAEAFQFVADQVLPKKRLS